MNIIVALDQVDAQEKPEIIQLRYLSADISCKIYLMILLKTAGDIKSNASWHSCAQ